MICPPEVQVVYFVTLPDGGPRRDLPPLFRVPVSNAVERETLRADARLSWQIAQRVSAFADYGYYQQNISYSRRTLRDRDIRSHRFQIGVRIAHDLDSF